VAKDRFVIAVDLGGTKISSAVVSLRGKVLASDYRSTPARRGVRAVIKAIADSARAVRDESRLPDGAIDGIGLAAAGISNPDTGTVFLSPNLPGWRNIPVTQMVADATGKHVFLINDANAAALGEMYYGVAKGHRDFVYVTISTGIGGGIILGGKLCTGAAGMAGEVGHMTVVPDGLPCHCGGSGCWEMYASGTALARRAREAVQAGEKTAILRLAGGDAKKIDAVLVKEAADVGDPVGARLIAETARYLGMGLGSLINIFNPSLIVIGGGLSQMGDALLKPAFFEARRHSYRDAFNVVAFRVAEPGSNAGVLGAAVYAFEQLNKRP